MSCNGNGYGTGPQSDDYLYVQFYASRVETPQKQSARKCRRLLRGFYPSFTPILSGLSVNSSAAGSYSFVNIYGANFFPFGTTFIKFGNFGFLPATYYSSFNLSFVVPLNAVPGFYPVYVVNLYNGNFSRAVNQSYPGNLNFSKPILYTIT